jgi:hypothetical protein
MPSLKTVACVRGPRSLADGRFIAQEAEAKDVDVDHPENRALIDAGDLIVITTKRTQRQTEEG